MGNLEKPLTWALVIVFVGYLFAANCECGEESTCSLNNGFNINNAGLNNGFNISNPDINVDVLKVDADEAAEITYYKNEWGEDSLDINGNRIVFEAEAGSLVVDSTAKITYYKNMWGEDSLDINGNRVSFIFETETEK